jgi:Tfp pilus assembly protein PilN
MQQQINLFKFVKMPVKSALDARFILELFAGFLAILTVILVVTLIQEARLANDEATSKAALDAKRKELVALAGLYPQTTIPAQIIDATRLPMCNIKFSTYLQGFAEADVTGVWLTEISITKSGQEISLKGHALRTLQVQQFLLQLKQLKLFANLTFDILQLNDQPSPISFEVIGRSAPHG